MKMAKLANLMNKLNECRMRSKKIQEHYIEELKRIEKSVIFLRNLVKDKDKEIKELNTQLEVLLNE